ncbi:Tetratricopeptide repeat-like superfamily protein, putative isoform 1 [Hibiscus syriacus]|uniref:Tetratricopeptide repeat-like superfamily protein, putative isoform 1 n=1 Tax=Hibiscus syriacus TaxID=106335 RepID=A0A6A3D3P0_HIBSY|nr:Tetratricopeptide repeat-like superfamily protein, putative isoform 1 [Hibiscus syriacus]
MSVLQYPYLVNVSTLHVWNNAAFDDGGSEDTSTVKVSGANLESVPVNQSLIVRDEKKIYMEIEATEEEITRLSLKLESLRHEKAEYKARRVSMRGRTVASKFMMQKKSTKNFEKKIEDPLFSSAKTKLNPADVATSVVSMQSRRKSCFYKLRDMGEEKVKSRKGKRWSMSLGPKSRRTISKTQASRPTKSTVGYKRGLRREDWVLATIQPKNLFKEGEKSETAKIPPKQGRMVVSRYNQIVNQSNRNLATNNPRKRSLTETDNDESNRQGKRLASREETMDSSCKNQKSISRVKWENHVES